MRSARGCVDVRGRLFESGCAVRCARGCVDVRGRMMVAGGIFGRLVWGFSAAVWLLLGGVRAERSFRVEKDQFVVDGTPQRVLAGNFHYFRTPPEFWGDHLDRMRSMGLNAVEFYIPWNLHETEKGVFDFTSHGKSVTAFLDLVHDKNMLALVRPGPYICGEWEFGGFPAWFFENGTTIKLRTLAHPYIDYVDRWWGVLLPLLKPYLYEDGGPIVLVQVENEYGSYGDVSSNPNDAGYLQHLINESRRHLGDDVLLYTTDGGNEGDLKKGTFPDGQILSFGDGCTNASATWGAQKQFNPPGQSPFMCTEFYTGWLTHWGENYTATSSEMVTGQLKQVLDAGVPGSGSVSLYMAFGGSNFGYWSGANGNGGSGNAQNYRPVLQSYDYNAPIAEGGQHGIGLDKKDKFNAIQALLQTYSVATFPPEPPTMKTRAYQPVVFTEFAFLLDNVASAASRQTTLDALKPMEALGCFYGFVMYSVSLAGPLDSGTVLSIPSVQDRALVFLDDQYMGQISRANQSLSTVSLPEGASNGSKVDILVENEGRIGYSKGMDNERKGILDPEGVLVDNARVLPIQGPWLASCLGLEDATAFVPRISWTSTLRTGPTHFYRGRFTVTQSDLANTYLNMTGWSKGLAYMNGHLIGRFWGSKGPQQSLFVPAPWLKPGANELVVLELLPPLPASENEATKTVPFSTAPIYAKVHQ